MKPQAVRAAPHEHIAMLQRYAAIRVAASVSTPEKQRRQSERQRDDRHAEISLVAVLVQGQARTRRIAIEQAGVRIGPRREACRLLGIGGQSQPALRNPRPWVGGDGIRGAVAVAARVAGPAQIAAVGVGDGHGLSARGEHVPPGGLAGDVVNVLQQRGCLRQGEALEQHGVRAEVKDAGLRGVVREQVIGHDRWMDR